jgi:hypothetical protein
VSKWVCTVCGWSNDDETDTWCDHCSYSRYVTYQGELALRDGANGYVMRDRSGNVIFKGSTNSGEGKHER